MKENTREKNLQVINKNKFFYRIKEFFKKLFNRNINIEAESRNLNTNRNDKAVFKEDLKFNTYLIELQKKLKHGMIAIKDSSDKEKQDMIKLYRKQIYEKKNKLKNLNQEILFYRK